MLLQLPSRFSSSHPPNSPAGMKVTACPSAQRGDHTVAPSEPILDWCAHKELDRLIGQPDDTASNNLTTFLAQSHFNISHEMHEISRFPETHGGCSDIFTGYYHPASGPQLKVAVKKLRVQIMDDNFFQKRLVTELRIWSRLEHRHIQPLIGLYVKDDGYPCLVSEWMENGTVMNYLKIKSDVDLVQLACGIADGVAYLHAEGIVHSDIKPNHVLISNSGAPLLYDFGVSRVISMTDSSGSESLSSGLQGTIRYMSKELLDDSKNEHVVYSKESDVWAFGMTVYELLTKSFPYAEKANDFQVAIAIMEGTLPTRPIGSESQSIQAHILWYMCNFCWMEPTYRPLMSTIQAGLSSLHSQFGSAPRVSQYPNEACSHALRLFSPRDPAFSHILADNWVDTPLTNLSQATMKALSKADPDGDFLHILSGEGAEATVSKDA